MKEEHGAATVLISLLMVTLIAFMGLAVDISNLTYQRSRVQNSADNAALALAQDCATGVSAQCDFSGTGAQTLAQYYADQNSGGGTVTTSQPSSKSVRVSVRRDISMTFLRLIGFNTKPVSATAVANWNSHPTQGYPVLPLGVGYCTWANHQATTPTGNSADRVAIRTDILQSVRNLLSTVTGTAATVVDLNGLMNALGTQALDSCSDGTNQIVTLKGGVWLTGEDVVSSTLAGLFNYPAGSCKLNVGNDLNTFVGGVEGFAFLPTGCTAKFGPGKDIAIGKTVLLPVYKPSTTATSTLGLKANACVGVLASSESCVSLPPQIGVKIVGYAPFKITGWNYPGTPSANDPTVGCAPSNVTFNLYSVVNSLLTVVQRIANAVLLTTLSLLGSSGTLTTSLACNGLQGYFVKSTTTDPNFQYGPDGADLGATNVRLSE